jgi:hypothetical protein
MLQTVITSVVIASLLSAGGAYVSTSVMSAELDRAQADLTSAEVTITLNREQLVALKAAKAVADERDDQRWDDVKQELSKIRVTQGKILLALPERWRESD